MPAPEKHEIKPWNEFDANNKNLFVSDVCFDAEPPYMEVRFVDMSRGTIFFEIPYALAYYCAVHCSYTERGREMWEERGANRVRQSFADLLTYKYAKGEQFNSHTATIFKIEP